MKRLRVKKKKERKKKASVLSDGSVQRTRFLSVSRRSQPGIHPAAQRRPKGSFFSLFLSLCGRSVITKKGNLVVGCKSGRMAVSYDTCSNLVAKHALHRVLPSIVPHIVTHTDPDFSIIDVLAKYRVQGRCAASDGVRIQSHVFERES